MKHTRTFKRVSAVVLALTLLLAIPVASAASLVTQVITVKTGVEIYVDGVPFKPTDANGDPVEVFIYNGTTYLPARAIADMYDTKIDWDGANSRVYVGDVPGAHRWLLDVCPPYQTYGSSYFRTPATVKIAGDTYAHCISFYGNSGQNLYGLFNLDGEYEVLSFDVGRVDGSSMSGGAIHIYLDGELTFSADLTPEMLLTHYDIPLYNALQMKIVFVGAQYWSEYAMVNVEVS